jgi:hypothetical protein
MLACAWQKTPSSVIFVGACVHYLDSGMRLRLECNMQDAIPWWVVMASPKVSLVSLEKQDRLELRLVAGTCKAFSLYEHCSFVKNRLVCDEDMS